MIALLLLMYPVRAEQTFEIAVVAPHSGISFSIGLQYQIGVQAALAANTDGTLLGRKLIVRNYDDQCNSAIAREVAVSLAEEVKPTLIVGHSCSGPSISAAPIYAAANLLQISPASSHARLTELGIDSVFRMIGSDRLQAKTAVDYLVTHYGQGRIGIMYYPGVYSRGVIEQAQRYLKQRGVTPVLQTIGQAGAMSYVSHIQAFADADIDVLYLVGGGLDNGIFVRQTRMLGHTFEIISSDTSSSQVFLEAAGEHASGVKFTFPSDTLSLPTSSPAKTAIRAIGYEPDGYSILAYAATEVWLQAVRELKTVDTQAISTYLKTQQFDTALGAIEFDNKGDIVTPYQPYSWYQWLDGKRQTLPSKER